MITISEFKDILISKAGGKPLGKIPNFYSMVYQAMIDMKAKVDLPSAIRTVQLTNPIYSEIDNYTLPNDVQLGAILNLRPITPDSSFYDYGRANSRQLKIEQKFGTQNKYAIRNNNGMQYLFVDTKTTSPLVIHSCDSLTNNGAVTEVGVSNSVAVDTLQKISGGASLTFNSGVGSSNGLQVIGMTAIDLTTQKDILLQVYAPSVSNFTGIQVRIGQSGSDYYTGAVASDFFGDALKVGWNLVKIPKASFMVGGGTPTWSNVTWVAVDLLGTLGAVNGWRLDSILAQVGSIYEIDYYSNLQFLNNLGVRKAKPTDDADTIILQDDELSLFLGYFIEIMAVDLKQAGAVIDVQEYGGAKLIANTNEFKFKYPSQRQLPQTTYGHKPYIT